MIYNEALSHLTNIYIHFPEPLPFTVQTWVTEIDWNVLDSVTGICNQRPFLLSVFEIILYIHIHVLFTQGIIVFNKLVLISIGRPTEGQTDRRSNERIDGHLTNTPMGGGIK